MKILDRGELCEICSCEICSTWCHWWAHCVIIILANDSVMKISHPPFSVKNFEDWTGKVNAVPLDVFSDCFVQLLEMCKKWVAVKEIVVKRIKQFSYDFTCVCVLIASILELYCLTTYCDIDKDSSHTKGKERIILAACVNWK